MLKGYSVYRCVARNHCAVAVLMKNAAHKRTAPTPHRLLWEVCELTNTQIAEQEIAGMMFDSNFHHLLQQMVRRSSTISPVNERYVALLAMREHIIGFN